MPAQTTSVSAERRRAMLRTAMGPAIAAALADPRVIEIMVNPDGALRVDILGEGRVDTDVKLDAPQVERIIRLVASHVRSEVHGDKTVSYLPIKAASSSGAPVGKADLRKSRNAETRALSRRREG